ncbi:DUF1749-domain-containing protein [Polyplosphaeria fusca]|uniref:DUF1749-domain-containing protein n=1 Tax=Polyplosphaeria fusca TaxID=682080 RepID=A0A9P4R6V6_9PLEO|nr:DUF1749-domain-containing protein [Polyplosphaeria fusca]
MEYLVGDDETDFQRPHIDGAILQGGLSDREAFSDLMAKEGPDTKENYDMIIALAKEMVDEGRGLEMMARTDNPVADLFGAPMTAYRTHSLLSVGGDDDYFSSDLPDSRLAATFGNIPRDTPIMFLLGAADPYIPDTVDRVALVRRWTDAVRAGGGFVDDLNGGVPPEMTHNLNDEGAENAIQDLVQRVVGFLHRVDSELVQGSARLYSL